jgi:subtilisin family serine protease
LEKIMKKNFKLIPLALTFLISNVHAKDVFIGYKDQVDASFIDSSIKIKQVFSYLNIIAVEVEDEADVAHLRLDPNVRFIEASQVIPHRKRFISKAYPTFQKFKQHLTDGYLPEGLKIVKAEKVWENHTRGDKARVLVLDSGIDANHPDLFMNIEKTQNFLAGDPNDVKDTSGHGTHVAGTIAANGSGLLGVAPRVKILAGKVCNEGCDTFSILRGVEWGITEKVDVINMSLGGAFSSETFRQVYKRAEANNVIVVAASGNDGKEAYMFPASYPEVFSVGAIDFQLNIASFSNWSDRLDVVAPGVDVYSAVPQGSGRESKAKAIFKSEVVELSVRPMTGSGIGEVTKAEVVDANLGTEEDFSNINVAGKIALIKRGEITFREKYDNAINNGAIAAVIYNNQDEDFAGTLNDDVENMAVSLSKALGERIKAKLDRNEVVKIDLTIAATDYQKNNGTSMATPHVSAIAALMRSVNPRISAKKAKEILRTTTTKLDVPEAHKYGNGLVDALRAVEESAKSRRFFRFKN